MHGVQGGMGCRMDKRGAQKEKSSKQRAYPVKEGDRTCTWFGEAEAEREGRQRQGARGRKPSEGLFGHTQEPGLCLLVLRTLKGAEQGTDVARPAS